MCYSIFSYLSCSSRFKKETAKERYGEAIGYVAHSTANKIANIAHDIAEPANKKKDTIGEGGARGQEWKNISF